jgi:hypothetical protein
MGWLAPIWSANERFLQDIMARLVAGCGVLYTIFIALSLVGRLHPLEVRIAIAVGAVASLIVLSVQAARVLAALKGMHGWEGTDLILLGAVMLLIGLQLTAGLTPLIFYDLLVYHLFAPAQFLMSGSLTHLPWNVYASSPLSLQLILGMSLTLDASGQAAKLLYAVMGCLLAVGAYEIVRPAGRRAALVAAVCALSYPEFWVMQTLGITDLAVAALMLFGTIWTRDAFNIDWRMAVPAGVALGISLGSRYQAVILVFWIIVALGIEAFVAKSNAKRASVLKSLVVIGCLCLAITAPWLVRSYVYLGNPVFPLMQSILGNGGEWSPAQADLLGAEIFGSSIATIPSASRLFAPLPAHNGCSTK